ncbi:hypothetical protein Hanom_Chr14g01310061 [Helianthus anomalus]
MTLLTSISFSFFFLFFFFFFEPSSLLFSAFSDFCSTPSSSTKPFDDSFPASASSFSVYQT